MTTIAQAVAAELSRNNPDHEIAITEHGRRTHIKVIRPAGRSKLITIDGDRVTVVGESQDTFEYQTTVYSLSDPEHYKTVTGPIP